MRKSIIGVMGPGAKAHAEDLVHALELGRLIAQQGWVLLSGGRKSGVMDAVNKGAAAAGGLTIGILPTKDREMISDYVDIPIMTDMGSARNNINVLSSDVVIACGMESGTASEVALAIKSDRPVILLNCGAEAERFFLKIGASSVQLATSPADAISKAKEIIAAQQSKSAEV